MKKLTLLLVIIFSVIVVSCGDDAPINGQTVNPTKPIEPEPEIINPEITSISPNPLRVGDRLVINGVFAAKDNQVFIKDGKTKIQLDIESENTKQIICIIPENTFKKSSLEVQIGEKKTSFFNSLRIYQKEELYIETLDKEIYNGRDKVVITGYNFNTQSPELYVCLEHWDESKGEGKETTYFFGLKDKKFTVNKEGIEIIFDLSKTRLDFTVAGEWKIYVCDYDKNEYSNTREINFK